MKQPFSNRLMNFRLRSLCHLTTSWGVEVAIFDHYNIHSNNKKDDPKCILGSSNRDQPLLKIISFYPTRLFSKKFHLLLCNRLILVLDLWWFVIQSKC